MLLLLSLACSTPTPEERCDRCTEPDADCAPEDAKTCRELAETARIADPVDMNRAVLLSDRACTHSDGPGCAAIGLHFEDGQGVPDDDAKALTLFGDACDLGAGVGCFNAGLMYREGHGVPRDDATANSWFVRAEGAYEATCAAGDLSTCMNLGLLYEQGFGVAKDPAKARALYDKACDGGYRDACVNAAWMRLDAPTDEADEKGAVDALRQGCDAGNALSCAALGQLYVSDKHGVPIDGARAVELLERACHAGSAVGCNVLAAVLGMGESVPADPAAAAGYAARACDLGQSGGCLMNGLAATTRADAEKWLARACGMGNGQGCVALANVRDTPGDGQDAAGAAKARAAACQLGVAEACPG